MLTQNFTFYTSFLAGLSFLTILLGMMLFSILRQFRLRVRENRLQLSREIELIDAERRRIHQDLHDEFGSGLSAIGLLSQQWRPAGDSKIPEKIFTQVQQLRKRIREIAYDFAPPALENGGLAAAVQAYLDEINSLGRVLFYHQISIHDKNFRISKCLHIYRIIREILINALKHSRCSVIRLSLHEKGKLLTICVTDNGTGFDYEKVLQRQQGSGLSHIRARAELLEASLHVASIKGRGTRYYLQIPLLHLIQTNTHDSSN
ncbi:MAG TPA: ATP-binding protein [Sediminibacterium sp.]|nr:ATP-binding protein [Sediminibacterium sp.]